MSEACQYCGVDHTAPPWPARTLDQARAPVVCTVEREYLGDVLHLYRGRVLPAAVHAGVSRRTFARMLKKYKVALPPRVRRDSAPLFEESDR